MNKVASKLLAAHRAITVAAQVVQPSTQPTNLGQHATISRTRPRGVERSLERLQPHRRRGCQRRARTNMGGRRAPPQIHTCHSLTGHCWRLPSGLPMPLGTSEALLGFPYHAVTHLLPGRYTALASGSLLLCCVQIDNGIVWHSTVAQYKLPFALFHFTCLPHLQESPQASHYPNVQVDMQLALCGRADIHGVPRALGSRAFLGNLFSGLMM